MDERLDAWTHARCAYCEQPAAKDIEHFYPKQSETCRQEGEWLIRALANDGEAVGALKKSQGTTPNLRVKYWQK